MTKPLECVKVLVAVKLSGVGVEKIRTIYLAQLYIHFKGKYGNVIEVSATVFQFLKGKYLKKVFIVQMHGDILCLLCFNTPLDFGVREAVTYRWLTKSAYMR